MQIPAPAAQHPASLRPHRRRFASVRAIAALMLREMATSYGRLSGGYLWAVVEPAASIALLTIIFSFGFRSPPLGVNFPIFYATGMLPFLLYLDVSTKLSTALMFSRPLLAYPSVTYVDALVARFILNLLTQLLVAYIILTGILLLFDTRTVPDLAGIALAFFYAAALSFGVGVANSFLFGMLPFWQRVWSIGSRPLFLISCIFFTLETVPEPFRSILWFNPLVHVIGQMRAAFYPGYDASYVSPAYILALSLAFSAMGLLLLRRFHRSILSA